MNKVVFIIDDDEAARESLTLLLRAAGFKSRAFESPLAFLEQLHPELAGCVVANGRMPQMDGVALVNHLNDAGYRLPIIVITKDADVQSAVQAMKAGVADFIEKPCEDETLLNAVRAAMQSVDTYRAANTSRAVVARRRSTLSKREEQVMMLVVEGLSNKEIGLQLGISPRTVEIYRANVMTKMEAESLSALVRLILSADAA